VEARGPEAFDSAFAAMTSAHAGALLVLGDALVFQHRRRLAELAATSRLPTMYQGRMLVEVGGLISYGVSLLDSWRRGATYVDNFQAGAISDQGELDDNVGPYGKSLLYLVSNAFEGKRETPLLGMQRFVDADPVIRKTFPGNNLIVAGAAPPGTENDDAKLGTVSRSDSHGGFDNDPATMNAVLYHILGGPPQARRFTSKDLMY
jgi:hypothetical protein